MPLFRRLTPAAGLLGILSAAACAPLGHGPSPLPLPASHTSQLGTQLNLPVTLPLPTDASVLESGFGNTFWFRQQLDADLEIIVETGANVSGGIFPYGNVALRRYLRVEEGLVSVAVEGSVGLISIDVGLPMALRLGRLPIWFTSHPSVGFFYYGWTYVPIGIAARPLDSLEIAATAGTFMFSQNFDFMSPSAQLAVSYSW